MLLGSATPFELMMGKVLSAVGVSLTSSSFYVAGGTLAVSGMGMLGLAPLELLPWFYVYLIADVVMLCALAAALGAAASTPRRPEPACRADCARDHPVLHDGALDAISERPHWRP